MALIKCSHCSGMISDKATKCPKCGNEVVPQKGNFEIKVPKKKVSHLDDAKLLKNNWVKTSILLAVLLLCLSLAEAITGLWRILDLYIGDTMIVNDGALYGHIAVITAASLLLLKSLIAIVYKKTKLLGEVLNFLKHKVFNILVAIMGIVGVLILSCVIVKDIENNIMQDLRTLNDVACPKNMNMAKEWTYETDNDGGCYSGSVARVFANELNTVGLFLVKSSYNTYVSEAAFIVVENDSEFSSQFYDFDRNLDYETSKKYHDFGITKADTILIDGKQFINEVRCCIRRFYWDTKANAWSVFAYHGREYENLLKELKNAKTLTWIHGKQKATFNVEGLKWGETIVNNVVAEKKQEVVKIDSTKVNVSTGDDYERRTISDLKRMGLNGPVMELELCVDYFESETECTQYQFDKNGMLTKSQNELVGYPSNAGGIGVSSTCVYKNGKLVSSVLDDAGTISVFNYEYQKVSDTQTDVYRISIENDNKEKAKSLYYDNEGNLIQKSIYYDMNNSFIYEYNKDGVMSLAIEQNASEQITQKDEYGNWTEIVSKDCKTTRRISYY